MKDVKYLCMLINEFADFKLYLYFQTFMKHYKIQHAVDCLTDLQQFWGKIIQ